MAKKDPEKQTLEFAIGREIEAYHFYLALADRVADSGIRKVFEELAAEELEHKAKLELEILKTGRVLRDVPIPPARNGYVVGDGTSLLDMEFKDVLQLGVEKEQASFEIYVSLAGAARDEESRQMLLALAEEEVRHKMRFEKELASLLKGG